MRENGEAQQRQKRLRRHNRKLLAAMVAVVLGYLAALFCAMHWSIDVL
jgi:hypothetical protein